MNPPDYATATANQRTYGSVQQTSGSHPPETSQQQIMSDAVPVEVDEEAGLLPRKPARERKRRRCSRWCGSMTTCNTILIIAVIVLIVLLSKAADSGHDSTGNPIKSPVGNEDGKHDDPASKPYFPPSECSYQHYSETQYFDFPSVSNFTFSEFMESISHLSGGIEGTVSVQPATQPDQAVDIRLRVAYATTSPFRVVATNSVKDHNSFTLDLPDLQKAQESFDGRPCLSVFVGLEIRHGVKLENWAISTGNLDIIVADGLFEGRRNEENSYLHVNGDSAFSAVRGKAEIAHWRSRRTIVETISSGIHGNFALRDLVSLKTISGTIDANVDPEQVDPDKPMPAEFTALSTSGTIDVQFPTGGDIPPRDFRTRLETVSSPIRGTYIAGISMAAHSTSGDLEAYLLPYYADKQPVSIHTSSQSGKTKLKVLPPYNKKSWPSLASEHKSSSTSGTIDIIYPQQWEGVIDVQSNSGSVSIEGKDVEIDNRSFKPVWKHVTAHKGTGNGRMGFKTLSGSINVRVGDLSRWDFG